MKHAFSAEGKRALRETLARRVLLAFDFDGTLAPIVPRPEAASAPSAIAGRLAKLAALCPVAVISGRAIDDVRSRLGFSPHYVIGNHGAEGWREDDAAQASLRLDRVREHLAVWHDRLAAVGVAVEDKRMSLALHYRTARSPTVARAAIDEFLKQEAEDVDTFGGKFVVNIVPRGAPDKSVALMSLVEHAGVETAVFLGDDVNDEVVFERAPPHWYTVLVGRGVVDSRARFFLDSQTLVATLLQDMLDLLERDAAR